MKNAFTSVAIVAVLTNLMKNNMKKRSNINDIVYCAYILIVAILNQSTTAIAIILAIILFVLFYKLIGTLGKENRKKLFRYISIGVVVITIGLIIYIINGQNNGLIDFVTEKLGKDSTFSGRRAIWAQAVKFVIQSPLWGKGQSVVYDVWMNGVQVYSAHNTFLDFAVKYGCIATGLFLADLMIVILFACYNSDERIKNMLLIIMLVFIVAMLPEAMEGFYETWTVVQCVYMYSCGDKLFDMFEKKRIFKRRRK
jgi:O-antigen ligase